MVAFVFGGDAKLINAEKRAGKHGISERGLFEVCSDDAAWKAWCGLFNYTLDFTGWNIQIIQMTSLWEGEKNIDKKESSVPARKNMSHLLRLSRSGILWCNVSREEGEDPRRAIVRCIVSFRQVAMVKRDLQARRPSEISWNETCVSVVPDFTNLGTWLPLRDDDVQNCSKTDPLSPTVTTSRL